MNRVKKRFLSERLTDWLVQLDTLAGVLSAVPMNGGSGQATEKVATRIMSADQGMTLPGKYGILVLDTIIDATMAGSWAPHKALPMYDAMVTDSPAELTSQCPLLRWTKAEFENIDPEYVQCCGVQFKQGTL